MFRTGAFLCRSRRSSRILGTRSANGIGEAYVHLHAAGLELVARTDAATRPSVGDTVRASVRPADVHLFDAETGERVEP